MKRLLLLISFFTLITNANAQLLTKGSLSNWEPYRFDVDPWIQIAKIQQERKKETFALYKSYIDKSVDLMTKEKFELAKIYIKQAKDLNKKYDFVSDEEALNTLSNMCDEMIAKQKEEEEKKRKEEKKKEE